MKRFLLKYKSPLFLLIILLAVFFSGSSFGTKPIQKGDPQKKARDTVKSANDTIPKFRLVKKNGHASYYADKLNGRRTASGKRFDNSKYTCAHRTFPFGTKLRVTNEANGKSVIVEVTDRGPFTRGRELDLTKRAFMEIASSRYGGSLVVTIDEVLKK